jgi:hypothetical protein
MRSGQLPTYAHEAGRWRWTTPPDLASYAAQQRQGVDWHAVAAVALGMTPDEQPDAWDMWNADSTDNASPTNNA